MRRILLLCIGFLFSGILAIHAQMGTILIDFGNVFSPAPWNNLADPVAGRIDNLINAAGQPTSASILVYDPFNNINTAGTTSPSPSIGFPPSATGDSFYGNTGLFAGQIQPTGGVELSQLIPDKPYTITIFASRIGADNRETQYLLEGAETETIFLNPSNNSDRVATATLFPAADSTIRITASPGPNNTNPTGFFHLPHPAYGHPPTAGCEHHCRPGPEHHPGAQPRPLRHHYQHAVKRCGQ